MRAAAIIVCLLATALDAAPSGTYRLRDWVELPDHPRALAYDANGARLVATGGRDGFGYLVQTDGKAGSEPQEIPGGAESLVSVVAAESGLFLANRAGGLVQHVARGQVATCSRLRVGQYPGAMAIAPGGALLYVLAGCDWHPGVHDTGGALHILPLPLGQGESRVCPIPEERYGEPRSLCVSADGRTVYVATSPTDYGSVTILAVDPVNARIQAHHTISDPCIWVSRSSLALSRDGQPILAIDGREDSRLVLFSEELVPRRSLPLGRGPTVLATSPDGLCGIVASRGASCLQILDLAEFALGSPFSSPIACPSTLAFGADGRSLFVGSSYVPKVACLEYSHDPPAALPSIPTASGEERIGYCTYAGEESMLWTVRPDGTDRRLIARLPTSFMGGFVSISPDGRHILYTLNTGQALDLFLLDLVTGEKRRLTDIRKDWGIACMRVCGAVFVPHGQAIVCEVEFTMQQMALVIASTQGGPAYPLADHYDDRDTCAVPHPWDPDRLLFLYDSGNWAFNREIRLFDRDSDSEWLIRPRDGHAPSSTVWSMDGRSIYWERSGTELNSATDLWRMRSDGTEPRPLVSSANAPRTSRAPAAMAPDGSRLLWAEKRSDGWCLQIADLAQGTFGTVIDTGTYGFPFAWQRIVLPPAPLHVP